MRFGNLFLYKHPVLARADRQRCQMKRRLLWRRQRLHCCGDDQKRTRLRSWSPETKSVKKDPRLYTAPLHSSSLVSDSEEMQPEFRCSAVMYVTLIDVMIRPSKLIILAAKRQDDLHVSSNSTYTTISMKLWRIRSCSTQIKCSQNAILFYSCLFQTVQPLQRDWTTKIKTSSQTFANITYTYFNWIISSWLNHP